MWPDLGESLNDRKFRLNITVENCIVKYIDFSLKSIKPVLLVLFNVIIMFYILLSQNSFAFENELTLPFELWAFNTVLFSFCLPFCFFFANLLCFVCCWSQSVSAPLCLCHVTHFPLSAALFFLLLGNVMVTVDLDNKIKLMYGEVYKSLFRDKPSQESPLISFYSVFRWCAVIPTFLKLFWKMRIGEMLLLLSTVGNT